MVKKLASFLRTEPKLDDGSQADISDGKTINKQVQNAFRELSIIDLCMKFMYLYIGYKMQQFQEDYELFLNSVVSLINLTCLDNQFNCYYVFQWYKLFVGMILGEINVDDT